MPKLVKKGQIMKQIKIMGFWTNMSKLVDKNDPLKKEVEEAEANSPYLINPVSFSDDDRIKVTDSSGFERTRSSSMALLGDDVYGIPPIVNTEDPTFAAHLNNDLKLLDKLEKQYRNNPDNELLYQHIRLLKIKEQNALEGVGYCAAPGDSLYVGGFEKMNDVILNVDAEHLNDPDFIKKAEKSSKELGLTDLFTDFVDIQMHNSEWAKEWNQPAPDPKTLRSIGQKLKEDMNRMDEHMQTFERNCFDDLKKPENEQDLLNVTSKSDIEKGDIVYDFSKGKPDKPIRAVNGEAWDKQKEKFLQELEGQLIGADLMELQRNVKKGKSKVLSTMVQDMIDGCTAEYMDEFEKKKEKSKRAVAYDYIVRVQKLQEMELEANKGNDLFSKMCRDIAREHLRTPEALKAMSDMENQAMEEKVNGMTLVSETLLIKEIQKNITPPPQKQAAVPVQADNKEGAKAPKAENVLQPPRDFAKEKEELMGHIVQMLAVQKIADTIKSYKAGMEDMAEGGEGKAMTNEEVQEMTNQLMSMENIKSCADMIKDMADYKRLKKSITNLEELDKLKLDALDGSGGRLKERLHKASRMIIKEDTQRLRMEQQREIQKQQREIANRNAEPAVLKPTDNF